MDLGNAALRQAVRSGLPVDRVGRLFLSHLHPDHTADIVPFLFARNYAPAPWGDNPDLTIHGPTGTKDMLDAIYTAWPSVRAKDGGPRVVVSEYTEGVVFDHNGVEVRAVRVEHGDMDAFAFRVAENGRVFSYSGDTRLCDGVKAVAESAQIFLCECSCFPRGCEPLYCRDVHLSWEDVAEICLAAQPERLVLTHLYEPVLEEKPNPLDQLREALDIPVALAEDGLTLQV